jgi:hypothetical protein
MRGSNVTLSVNGTALTPVSTDYRVNQGTWYPQVGCYYGSSAAAVQIGSYILADGALTSTQEGQIDADLATLWAV